MNIGAFLIHAPWALLAAALLPVLWWLIRFLPPPPRRIWFPPLALLEGLRSATRARIHPNYWLLLLRMLICALVLAAMADIFYLRDIASHLGRESVRLIVIDNGWSAATGWQERVEALERLIDEAERDRRRVLLLTSADDIEEMSFEPVSAAKARLLADALEPLPWRSDRIALAQRLDSLIKDSSPEWLDGVEPVWIDDGIEEKRDGGGAEALASTLSLLGERGIAPRRLSHAYGNGNALLALRPSTPSEDADAVLLSPGVTQRNVNEKINVAVDAFDSNGKRVAREEIELDANTRETPLHFDLPLLSSSKIAQIAVQGQASAAAVLLQGSSTHRLPVAFLDSNPSQSERPYFSGLYYLRRALAPFVQSRTASDTSKAGGNSPLERLLEEAPAVVILDDVARMTASESRTLANWVERGGILIRFAGTNTAQAQTSDDADELLPVRLRSDERVLGGALSWDSPRRLGKFEEDSPFYGLDIPAEVTVSRQILSLPDSTGTGQERAQIWAKLSDGSPLVSARPKGRGLLVFFHVTAAPHWSNLPLSGLYVDMLRRILRLSPGPVAPGQTSSESTLATRSTDAASRESLRPFLTLDGFGVLGSPPTSARAFETDRINSIQASAQHPPGFYGNAGALESVNVLGKDDKIIALENAGADALNGIPALPLLELGALSLTPYLLWLAFALLLLDSAIALRSLRPSLAPVKAASIAVMLMMAAPAFAQSTFNANDVAPIPVPEALRSFTLAYVKTGNAQIDNMSRDGLRGLARELHKRTTVYSDIPEGGRPSDPIGVNIENDELAYFPLLYWPVTPEQSALSTRGKAQLTEYLRFGGMVLFDTRDRHPGTSSLGGGATEGELALQRLLEDIDIPPLMPASSAHALGKSFYLLDEFPGRYAGGRVWVSASEGEDGNKTVSPVVIGGHDWAAAWALNAFDRPLILPLPGRERQREMARRFGVNLVLYALTGNYKQDQVHLPILLERLAH
ncbi:MAG: DUF4159 domain-containing protein [Hyphomicrobiales bacterium]|nr:DUF4159 domain-containing protein [Hyphomicrobiales bacterium]MCY4048038.1 DUF4159 domain-containing protein [Hyphomicrobiales bacterium]MCY4052302.1 DUF4159 domain-containing protein [Hyphomicrobiales bacterium]